MSLKKSKKPILVTRHLSDKQASYAVSHGLKPLVCPAISIEFRNLENDAIELVKKNPDKPWIITSKNAARAFEKIDLPAKINAPQRIYVVGDKTADGIKRIMPEAEIAVPEKQTSEGLAKLILSENLSSEFIYFSGNRTTGVLSSKLKNAGKTIYRVEVYKTILNKMDFPDDTFEAVLFFSPSAVQAYQQTGGVERFSVRIFAIGPTTAKELKRIAPRRIYISPKPDTIKFLEYVAGILR